MYSFKCQLTHIIECVIGIHSRSVELKREQHVGSQVRAARWWCLQARARRAHSTQCSLLATRSPRRGRSQSHWFAFMNTSTVRAILVYPNLLVLLHVLMCFKDRACFQWFWWKRFCFVAFFWAVFIVVLLLVIVMTIAMYVLFAWYYVRVIKVSVNIMRSGNLSLISYFEELVLSSATSGTKLVFGGYY